MAVWEFFVRMCCSCFRGRGRVADEPDIRYRSDASSSDDESNILDSSSNSVTNDGHSEILVGNGDAYNQYVAAMGANNGQNIAIPSDDNLSQHINARSEDSLSMKSQGNASISRLLSDSIKTEEIQFTLSDSSQSSLSFPDGVTSR